MVLMKYVYLRKVKEIGQFITLTQAQEEALLSL